MRMNALSEQSRSIWMATAKLPDAPSLSADTTADVAVVGSGIAGLSTGYELTQAGESVVVLDRGPLVGGMTSRTSAHLTSAIDDLYQELIRMRGLAEARAYVRARTAAIDRIEEIHKIEKIDCDFKRLDGYLFPAKTDHEQTLKSELDACRRVGLAGVRWVTDTPIPHAGTGRALRYRNQARFHPRKYAGGLIRAIKRAGGQIFAHSPVVEILEEGGRVTLKTARGPTIRARTAVICTGSPINDRFVIHTKQAPYRSYVLAAVIPRKAVPDALYWDTLDPYHYVRLQPRNADSDWLIVGGEDHKTGEANDADVRLAKLEAWARSLVPDLGDVDYRWSGQVYDTIDYLPFTGRNPGSENVFVHTGDSGEGLTNGVIGALVLSSLARRRKHRWAGMLNPARKTAKAAIRFASENISVAANLSTYVTPGEVASEEEIELGSGAIVREGLKKLAVFRDKTGICHRRSATCTHSGCLLSWNSFEKCWDCNCHGSHFSVEGKVLNGPATMPLAEADRQS